METVGDSVTETREATEVCKQAQEEEHGIHAGSTNFYTRLQFFLLRSTWFPRPLGVCLWSAMHVLLVFYEVLVLLVVFSFVFVCAVLGDATVVASLISMVFLAPLFAICFFLYLALSCLWLVVSCECCTMAPRAPGQSLVHYILDGGGTVPDGPQNPQPAPAGEEGAAAVDGAAAADEFSCCAFLKELPKSSFTRAWVNHVTLVSFPYWRAQLRDSCREIVPGHDSIAM